VECETHLGPASKPVQQEQDVSSLQIPTVYIQLLSVTSQLLNDASATDAVQSK
jgi:hypothetical protein